MTRAGLSALALIATLGAAPRARAQTAKADSEPAVAVDLTLDPGARLIPAPTRPSRSI